MKKALLAPLAIVISMSCSSSSPPPDATARAAPSAAEPTAAPGTPDSEIGLARGTAFDQPPQPPIKFNTVDPGESEIRVRPNTEFPPVIPHSVEGLGPISRTENACLDCHSPEAAADSDATAIPASHQVDLRRAPDTQGDEVVGARWVCTSCHVTQTDTTPLVENTSRQW